MDEGWVVMVADASGTCEAFPFATKAAADAASEWFRASLGPSARTTIIDDHDRGEDDEEVSQEVSQEVLQEVSDE